MPTSPTPEAAEGEDDDGPYNEDEGQTDGGKAGQAGANEEEEDDEEGEEAENEGSGEVDMSNKTIKELMSMRRTGKPMSKTDDSPRKKKKQKSKAPGQTAVAAAEEERRETEEREEAEKANRPAASGPQVRFDPVTGEITIDEGTLTHFSSNPSTQKLSGSVVDIGNSTTTSSSYTNRAPSERWTALETRQFYKGLTMFGTDFTMIGKVIFEGSRDRRQIKNKFKREERENPTSVDQALITQFKE